MIMTSNLAEKLRSGFPSLTKSEKAVANYMLMHQIGRAHV